MKLVAAKCPSCGANIDVNPERKTTKCEYCNSKIVIEDAIAKFKIEISGEVEIKNMPKLINYIKLGNRSYNDLEYKEALNYYTKALELDPDNYIAILRIGICKTLLTDYAKFEIKHAFNAIRHVNDLLRKNNQTEVIDSCIIEVNNTFNWLVNLIMSFYNNSYKTDISKINGINDKLMSCITAFEYLYNISEKEDTKKIVLKSLVLSIDFLLQKKKYNKIDKNGNNSYGYETLKPYERFNLYSEKREKYLCELDPAYAKKKEEERQKQEEIRQNQLKRKKEKEEEAKRNLKIPFRPIDILSYIGAFICLLMFLACISTNIIISSIVWLAGAIIFIPYVKNFIVSKNGEMAPIIIVARILVFFFGFLILGIEGDNTAYYGEWTSKNGIELSINEENITIKNIDGKDLTNPYEETEINVNDDTISYYYQLQTTSDEAENIILRYIYYTNDTRDFCLLKDDKCDIYFQPKEKSNIVYVHD